MPDNKKKNTGGSLGTIFTGPSNENPGVLKAKSDKAKAAKSIESKKKNTKVIVKPKFTMFGQANAARNNSEGEYTDTPAKRQDSLEYRAGFNLGVRNKLKGETKKMYQETEFQKMGRWEGQNHSFKNKDAEVIAKKVGK